MPVLAKLGDMLGHKRMLLVATALTAGASWWIAFAGDFWSFLDRLRAAGLLCGLAAARGRAHLRPRPPQRTARSQTRRAAGLLVVALEAGAIIGALSGCSRLRRASASK